MAWYVIEHSCGHDSEQQIYGTNSHGERERQAERLGKSPCRNCRTAALHQQGEADAAAAADRGWPDLVGSPKQISWANSIRTKILSQLDKDIAAAHRAGQDHAHAVGEIFRDVLLRQLDAGKWINADRTTPKGAVRRWATKADRQAIEDAAKRK